MNKSLLPKKRLALNGGFSDEQRKAIGLYIINDAAIYESKCSSVKDVALLCGVKPHNTSFYLEEALDTPGFEQIYNKSIEQIALTLLSDNERKILECKRQGLLEIDIEKILGIGIQTIQNASSKLTARGFYFRPSPNFIFAE